MKGKDRAYWLADKIPSYGDYAKEAAIVLRQQADEIEMLRDWIRHESAISDTCTFHILGEICDGCGCKRKVPNAS